MFNERLCLGFGVWYGIDLFEAIRKTKLLGFQGMMNMVGGESHSSSMGEFPTFNWYNLDEAGKRKLKEALKDFKHITLHQSWDDRWRDWVDCAEYLGAEMLTIHDDVARESYFPEILKYIKGKRIKIGIENVDGKFDDHVELIKSIDNPQVGATIDVGHCAIFFEEVREIQDIGERTKKANELILRLIRELGKRVYHFHLHNVRNVEGKFIDHRCVSEGIIDFKRIFSLLKEIGYKGLFDIELEERDREEKASQSGEYLTKILSIFGQ
jgi:sugar phosphate isomerase/epimerase